MAQRATSLGPKTSVFSFRFVLFLFFLAILSLFLFIEKPCSPQKGIFGLFLSVSLCFSLAFFGPPLFSLSLSLSFSCSFLSSFLSVSHFCIWFLLFLFVLFAFLFQDVTFLLFCLLSCFVLNHNISLIFPLHLVSIFCCFLFLLLWYVVIF